MWAMERLPCNAAEWTLPEKLRQIEAAGFDGVEIAWSPTMPEAAETVSRAEALGLKWSIECFPKTVDDLKPIVERFAGTPVRHINVQANVRPHTVLEAIPYVLGWMEIARDAQLTVYFETHRDRMTTSLRYTLALIDAIPAMELVADLSHYLLGEEFAWPVSAEDHALIRRVLSRASGFHGRVASREQIQVPISFDYNRQWLELFSGWWAEGFALRRAQAPPGRELIFVTELGPPWWYALTDGDGAELSDRWQEALALKQLAHQLWDQAEEEQAARSAVAG